MARLLGVSVIAARNVEEVVGASQAMVTCTPSRQPVVDPAFLHPGLHITAMGADLPEKRELMADVCERADLALSQATLHGLGIEIPLN